MQSNVTVILSKSWKKKFQNKKSNKIQNSNKKKLKKSNHRLKSYPKFVTLPSFVKNALFFQKCKKNRKKSNGFSKVKNYYNDF